MEPDQVAALEWIMLPFSLDSNEKIRTLYDTYKAKAPIGIEHKCNTILPHTEDNYVLPLWYLYLM
jgi:hypothetical protein